MWYLIVPPIIIVISSALLVFFISRKIAKIPVGEMFDLSRPSVEVPNSRTERIITGVNHASLALLERFTRWLKVTLLRFHNRFDSLFQVIKEKRKKVKEQIEFDACPVESLPKRVEMVSQTMSREEDVQKVNYREREDKIPEPMISKEVVQPDSKATVKEKLEQLLIERIATDPRDIEAYERLGDYYMERKCYRDARECFKHVLKLSPANRRTKLKMRRLDRIFLK